jgi:pimeloyl-ACP methyl ester carboxylesterase
MEILTEQLEGMPVRWRRAEGATPAATQTLYLHGAPSSSAQWEPFLEAHGGIAPDLPGFGQTGKPGSFSYTFDGYAAWLDAFAAHAGLTEPFDLVVHGWGAIGLPWALAAPGRVRRLALLAPVPLLPGFEWGRLARIWRRTFIGESAMGFGIRPVFDRVLQRFHGGAPLPATFLQNLWDDFDPGTQRAVLRLHRHGDPETLAAQGRELSRFRGEALVAWGSEDRCLGSRWAGAYAEQLPGGRVLDVPGVGHWIWLDHPELVGIVSSFLRSA